jgi:hypothetical protein
MELRKFLAIVTGLLVIGMGLLIWFFPVNADFRIENPLWNGIDDIASRYGVQPLDSLADLPVSSHNSTLIAIPYLTYTPAELELLRDYIYLGGTLILADDFGHGNQILAYLGLDVRFSGATLLDPLINYKSKYLPLVFMVQADPLTNNTGNITFNHGTNLINISANNSLALSSAFSFQDNNENGMREDDEPTGPLPVSCRFDLGKGQLVLISDPSIFINAMEKMENNAAFLQNIARIGAVTYIDQSHLATSDLLRTKGWLKQARSLLTNPASTTVLVAAVIVVALTPVWHRKKQS